MAKITKNRQNLAVRDFILRHLDTAEISALTAETFGLSRTAVNRYIRHLIEDGLILAEGKTRARTYKLRPLVSEVFLIPAARGLDDDAVWRYRILPLFKDVAQNVVELCHYSFTEMLNNVFDHSGSPDCNISFQQTYAHIDMVILDRGIGIFQRIQSYFHLEDARSALLELSKGKLTSDKANHSGEGIFFTSRMVDRFAINSGDLFYIRENKDDFEWLVESGKLDDEIKGTAIIMHLSTDADWTTKQIFNRFQGDDIRFKKTHVPIKLGRYGNEQLVSRSQAKRVLARFNEFSEILLDFEGIADVGRAFIDEIFRVFRKAHPDIRLSYISAAPAIARMIESAMLSDGDDHPDQPERPLTP